MRQLTIVINAIGNMIGLAHIVNITGSPCLIGLPIVTSDMTTAMTYNIFFHPLTPSRAPNI